MNTHSGNCLNPLKAKLNPICHLLALVGVHHILHISRIRVNNNKCHYGFISVARYKQDATFANSLLADSSHFLIIYFYLRVDIIHFLAKDMHYVYLLLIFCTS
jgi:hypothetical protein